MLDDCFGLSMLRLLSFDRCSMPVSSRDEQQRCISRLSFWSRAQWPFEYRQTATSIIEGIFLRDGYTPSQSTAHLCYHTTAILLHGWVINLLNGRAERASLSKRQVERPAASGHGGQR